jgi:hypothetical protein
MDSDGMGDACDTCPLTAPARIAGTQPIYYPTIWHVYNNALNEDTIQIQNITYVGDFDAHMNKSVTIEGGYNCEYSAITGTTTLNGNMIISNGTLTILSGTLKIQ